MRTVFEEEEEEIAPRDPLHEPSPDRELTISSTTLLAIFFGLVLICGLFFGLGYTLGRRSPAETAQLPSAGDSSASLQASPSISKPSAAPQPAAPADAQTADSTSIPAGDTAADTTTPDGSAQAKAPDAAATPAPQIVKAALPQPAIAAPQATPAPASATPAAVPGTAIMVQIAAISNPADADVLMGALQKRGYTVTARRTTTDSLIHVQVGPFTNRADAIAMRQKLLADGYNAILK
jgi:cell division septation protein DedD